MFNSIPEAHGDVNLLFQVDRDKFDQFVKIVKKGKYQEPEHKETHEALAVTFRKVVNSVTVVIR